ncbi:MAG: peptide deformylase [Alphaproteobacteria bacterium]|nr:peptide deformylase [Alphaproteobacteria bacterium]
MAIRPIIRFPDPRLRQRTVEVAAFDVALKALAADLLDTMRAAPGVGIAGPHIGVMLRVVVIELGGDVRTYVNPVVEWSSPETTRIAEGSISMPGVNDEVERPARVRVRFRDLGGAEKVEEADGFRATCLQHEIDQLDGVFWIDRLSRLKRDRLTKRFAKLGRA